MSGLTRSSSNQRTSSAQGHRFQSPGAFSQHSNGTPTSAEGNNNIASGTTNDNRRSSYSSQQRANFYQSALTTTGAAGQGSNQQQQQQQCVSIDEFMALKRQLERERSQREDAVSQLREEIFELKETRRREKLDSNMYSNFSNNSNNANNNNQHQQYDANTSSRGFYQNYVNSMGAHALDNSILGRLNRVENYQSSALQQQLEALEERLRVKIDDKGRSSSELSRSEQTKLQEKIESVSSAVNNLKHEINTTRLPAIENKVSEISSLSQKNASQIEVLHTHRLHDEETSKKLQQDLQNIHGDIKSLDAAVDSVKSDLQQQRSQIEGVSNIANQANNNAQQAQKSADEAQKEAQGAHGHADRSIEMALRDSLASNKSAVDEKYVQSAIDSRVTRSQEETKEYFQARLALVETKMQDGQASSKENIQHLNEKVDSIETRSSSALEQRCSQVENTFISRNDEGLKSLEARMESRLKEYNSSYETLVNDLKANLDARTTDKVNCSRDEIETEFCGQLGDLAARLEELSQQFQGSSQTQSTVMRSLLNTVGKSDAAACQVLDGIEHFVRDHVASLDHHHSSHQSSGGSSKSSVYTSVLNCIATARQDDDGLSVGDALKILYQFERGQIINLTQMREEISELRVHIGLVGSGVAAASAHTSPNPKEK